MYIPCRWLSHVQLPWLTSATHWCPTEPPHPMEWRHPLSVSTATVCTPPSGQAWRAPWDKSGYVHVHVPLSELFPTRSWKVNIAYITPLPPYILKNLSSSPNHISVGSPDKYTCTCICTQFMCCKRTHVHTHIHTHCTCTFRSSLGPQWRSLWRKTLGRNSAWRTFVLALWWTFWTLFWKHAM